MSSRQNRKFIILGCNTDGVRSGIYIYIEKSEILRSAVHSRDERKHEDTAGCSRPVDRSVSNWLHACRNARKAGNDETFCRTYEGSSVLKNERDVDPNCEYIQRSSYAKFIENWTRLFPLRSQLQSDSRWRSEAGVWPGVRTQKGGNLPRTAPLFHSEELRV